jgi:hypothetical protein
MIGADRRCGTFFASLSQNFGKDAGHIEKPFRISGLNGMAEPGTGSL